MSQLMIILATLLAGYCGLEFFKMATHADKERRPLVLLQVGFGFSLCILVLLDREHVNLPTLLALAVVACDRLQTTILRAEFNKPVTTAWIIFAIIIASILLGASMTANAEEPEKPKVTDCTPYKPSPADSLYYKCKDLVGTIDFTIYLCGEPFNFKAVCKAKTGVKNEAQSQ
jgi:hypothetical protein